MSSQEGLITYLLGFSALHFVVWTQGQHILRYLLPSFPALSVVAAYVLAHDIGGPRLRFAGRHLRGSLVVLSLAFATSLAFILLVVDPPFAQLVGLQSRQDYLSRTVSNHDAVRYLNSRRDQISGVLIVGDNRTFYIDPPATMDMHLRVFSSLATTSDPLTVAAELRRAGISHILVGQHELVWLSRFDPERRVLGWWTAFERTHHAYLVPEFSSDMATVYRVLDVEGEIQPQALSRLD